MLKHFKKLKLTGFSLFEVMLVLLVASMIAVAGVKYAQHQREVDSDQLYGMNLYTFGQAVTQYLNDAKLSPTKQFLPGPLTPGNQNACYGSTCTPPIATQTVNGNMVITATGVDWLKKANTGPTPTGGSYLDDKFSFTNNMTPLIIAAPDPTTGAATKTGNNAITTTITITPTGNQVKINIGALYEPSTGIDPNTHLPLPPTLSPMLTQEAITHANTLYSSTQGAPAIQYNYPYVDATTGKPTPSAQVTGQLNSSTAQTADQFLRLDGTNMMKGDIRFDTTALQTPTSHVSITGLNTIYFAQWNDVKGGNILSSRISNLDKIEFNLSGGSVINYLAELDFNGAGSSLQLLEKLDMNGSATSAITSLNTLTFSGTVSNAINNVAKINFNYNTSKNPGNPNNPNNILQDINRIVLRDPATYLTYNFEGIRVLSNILFNSGGQTTPKTTVLGGRGYNRFCALGRVYLRDNIQGSGRNNGCTIYLDGTNTWVGVAASTTSDVIYCEATCFDFAPRVP